MLKIKLICLLFVSAFIFGSTEELLKTDPPKRLIHVDFGFLTEGWTNNGTGLGIGLEHTLYENFSFKVRHGVLERSLGTTTVTHIITSFLITWHPFTKGTEGWNLAAGYGYCNTHIIRDPQAFYYKLFPFYEVYMGYQFILWNRVLIEPYFNFIFPTKDVELATTGIHSFVNIDGVNIGVTF